ncbi:unnamed protein product [Rangifer tarandus platyrhynchus]|uniref:Uncharacterized protein n=2 Tax=Rangifer tarandus platyrhynchus TaxID=3082113 RepID=A0AC59YWW1_RANTA|nr:unnamed protein product [Rangifer tarandus platyrhynchus]
MAGALGGSCRGEQAAPWVGEAGASGGGSRGGQVVCPPTRCCARGPVPASAPGTSETAVLGTSCSVFPELPAGSPAVDSVEPYLTLCSLTPSQPPPCLILLTWLFNP